MAENNLSNNNETPVAEREMVVERIFNAPRHLVWKAWTEPERVAQWWGPKGWTLPVCKIDFRPGGTWHYCMLSPEGQEAWGKAVYQEIVEPERIVYLDVFSDEAGNATEGMPVLVVTVLFEEVAGKTRLTNRALFASAADKEAVMAMGMEQGLTDTFDRLEEHLSVEQA